MEVKSILIAVHNVESVGINSRDVLLNSIVWLRQEYERVQDEAYLKKAIWHIYAYLELGYPYEYGEEEFGKILEYLKEDIEDVFPGKKWRYKKIMLTKSNVSRLLGKWNSHLQSMKIDEAVSDIIDKVEKREVGKFVYHCGKLLEQEGESCLWENTFVLYVTETEAIFHNKNKSRYYILSEGKR